MKKTEFVIATLTVAASLAVAYFAFKPQPPSVAPLPIMEEDADDMSLKIDSPEVVDCGFQNLKGTRKQCLDAIVYLTQRDGLYPSISSLSVAELISAYSTDKDIKNTGFSGRPYRVHGILREIDDSASDFVYLSLASSSSSDDLILADLSYWQMSPITADGLIPIIYYREIIGMLKPGSTVTVECFGGHQRLDAPAMVECLVVNYGALNLTQKPSLRESMEALDASQAHNKRGYD